MNFNVKRVGPYKVIYIYILYSILLWISRLLNTTLFVPHYMYLYFVAFITKPWKSNISIM